MALFEIPTRNNSRESDSKIIKQSRTVYKATPKINGSSSLLDRIHQIQDSVDRKLSKYKDKYILIQEESQLHDYISTCIDNSVISIDTETTGLDPLLDDIAGICIYTPNEEGAYIPINHISYITNTKLPNQLDVGYIRAEFERIINKNIDIIMFNAKFDIRVLRNKVGLHNIYCTWDCYLAQRLLNENEPSNALKKLHQKYVLNGKEDAFTFEELFKGIPFTMIPLKTAVVYAGHDPVITYELYEYQKKYLKEDSEREDMRKLYWVFMNIEMPCVKILSDMEDNGVTFDFDTHAQLYTKYHKLLEEQEYKVKSIIKDNLNLSEDDVSDLNLNSPKQMATIIYDKLNLKSPDDSKPRGTGSDLLSNIDHPVCEALIKYREYSKLVTSFIDNLPQFVNPKDGKIHCSFKQYGADTGRMSCVEPNLQQIPSQNHEIRQMFRASEGCVLLSSDYSAQEPRITAQMCGDPAMIKAYKDGKDLYAEIASIAFNKPYEDCLEFNSDGSHNPEGKKRRQNAKSILLGVTYGRGINSVAEQLKCNPDKAKVIQDKVFKGFPKLKEWEVRCKEFAKEYGYVTTFWGRKRRLPDLQLEEYEFHWANGVAPDNDLLDFDSEVEQEIPEKTIRKYLTKLHNCRFREKRKIIEQAKSENIIIIDNGGKIAEAERKSANSIIQGSAADLTKLALISVGNDKILKDLGFKLLIPVHDELIGECPKENAKAVADRFAFLMVDAARDLDVPVKCDVEITEKWYGEEIAV